MKYDFSEPEKAQEYLQFSLSEEGLLQQALIWEALRPLLPTHKPLKAVDAGSGTGWLAGKLSEHFDHVVGFDSSEILINFAKEKFRSVNFIQSDQNQKLPFTDSYFDLGVASLILHDLPDLRAGFTELARIIKPGGSLFVVELNPYYAYPVGSWKRTWWEKLTRTKPKLKLASYMKWARKTDRTFAWLKYFSLFYTLPEMINAGLAAGFDLQFFQDIASKVDSDKLDLHYRSYRFPVFVLYQFTRPGIAAKTS